MQVDGEEALLMTNLIISSRYYEVVSRKPLVKKLKNDPKINSWRAKWHEIIYEADSREGKIFDLVLIVAILFSIVLVMLESVKELDAKYHNFFNISEWAITILFTIEYILRIITVKKPKQYIFSFYGIVDLLSTIPKYISLFIGGAHALVALRALRLLRIFRIYTTNSCCVLISIIHLSIH